MIIPVYNTEAYLRELLDSLVEQDLRSRKFEVIAVNDGSTDASGSILDEYANRYPNFRVVHQENSGWAGKPRNVALDLAQGQFVFFADSDDVLAPSALRQMLQFASKHKIDVVLPKVAGLGGRAVNRSLYAKTNPSITPLQAIKTLTPQKLISRELIESNGLRFPEEPVRLEDGMFMVACYLRAKRLGVVADGDLYSLRARPDGSNLSRQRIDPYGYTASISKIAEIIRAEAKDAELAQSMTLALWSNKGLNIYAHPRFNRYSEKVQNKWVDAHSNFLNNFIPNEAARNLSDILYRKTEFIRNQDKQGVLCSTAVEEQLSQRVSIESAHYANGELKISGTLLSSSIDSVCVFAKYRGEGQLILAEVAICARNGVFDGTLSGIPESAAIIDIFLKPATEAIEGSPRRAQSGESPAFSTNGKLTPYSTKHGNLSLQPI